MSFMYNTQWTYKIVLCPNNMVSISTPYGASTHKYESFEMKDGKMSFVIDGKPLTFKPHETDVGAWRYDGADDILPGT